MAAKFERPPPHFAQPFSDYTVLPELAGRTPASMAANGLGLLVFCRACGREVVITPYGLHAMPSRLRDKPVEFAVKAMRCETCGSREAQGSSWPMEQPDQRASYVRRAHTRAEFRRNG